MVSIGAPITVTDLQALATAANSKSTLTSWANIGTNTIYKSQNIAITHSGVNYLPGDIFNFGLGDSYQILSTGSGGAIAGIRVLNQGQTTDTSLVTSPVTAIGGSGTGAVFNFAYGGAILPQDNSSSEPYGFGEFNPILGSLPNVYLMNSGSGYTTSSQVVLLDVQTIPPYYMIDVTGVNASGSITNFTIDGGPSLFQSGSFNIPSNVYTGMAATTYSGSSGSGAIFGGNAVMLQSPTWLTELNRLRYNLNQSAGGVGGGGGVGSVWNSSFGNNILPITNTNPYLTIAGQVVRGTTSFNGPNGTSAANMNFYYQTNNYSTAQMTIQCIGSIQTWDPAAALQSGSSRTSLTVQIKVAGDFTADYNTAGFVFLLNDPSGSGACTVTPGFGGGFTQTPSIGGNFAMISGPFTGSLGPGVYTFTATATGYANFVYPFMYGNEFNSDEGYGNSQLSYTIGGSGVAANAINDTSNVNVIQGYNNNVPLAYTTFGVYNYQPVNTEGPGLSGSRQNYAWIPISGIQYGVSSGSYNDYLTGFWAGTPCPVSNLNQAPCVAMPWNFVLNANYASRPTVPYSYNPMLLQGLNTVSGSTNSATVGTNCEQQVQPYSWLAHTYFTNPWTIMDYNGNIQECILNGWSGGGAPTWATASGLTTTENSAPMPQAVWRCIQLLTGSLSMIPYQSRGNNIFPNYPAVNVYETNPEYSAPTGSSTAQFGAVSRTVFGTTSQWRNNTFNNGGVTGTNLGWNQNNLSFGWFIYSIAPQRMGSQMMNGVLLQPQNNFGEVEQISVEVGCMRNGSFVSFGTFQTGQTYTGEAQGVLWPIFSSSPLYYKTATNETILLQAVAISYGGQGVATGVNISYPICSNHLNDCYSVLSNF